MTISATDILKNPVHCLAFGFGAGLSPKAPGTVGTLVAIPIYLLMLEMSFTLYIGAIVVCFGLGIWLCGRTARDLGVHDHGGIVWDEFVGFWITMILVPATWFWILGAFFAFRLFDILKPFPISWLDKKVSGGLGIMIDDVVAGIYASIVIQILIFVTGY